MKYPSNHISFKDNKPQDEEQNEQEQTSLISLSSIIQINKSTDKLKYWIWSGLIIILIIIFFIGLIEIKLKYYASPVTLEREDLVMIQKQQIEQFAKYIELKNSGHQDLAKEEYDYYQAKYKISQYKQLPFCVVIPSYNNVKNERYKKNIDSIIRQNYSNFHVVFMDDKSTDGTGQKMQKYVNSLDQNIKNKIKIIINSEHQTALPSLVYAARNQCKPQQIYTIVDGDDQLIGRQVLKALNAYYQQTGAWFVYSNLLWKDGVLGYSSAYPSQIIEKGQYRSYPQFLAQHIRSFYTKLFRLINDKDLRDRQGKYYQVTSDMAILYPILQMCHKKAKYFPQITYNYNFYTGLNDIDLRGQEQLANGKQIKEKLPYKQLKQLFNSQQNINQKNL